jgi:hypothetical protein
MGANVWFAMPDNARRVLESGRYRFDAVHAGWAVRADRDPSKVPIQPRMEPALERTGRADLLAAQLEQWRRFCGTSIVSADASADDAPGRAALAERLGPWWQVWGEALPLRRVSPDPAADVGYVYEPDAEAMKGGTWVCTLTYLRRFDRHERWAFRGCTVHLLADAIARPGELESAVRRGMTVGVWPQWIREQRRMQSEEELAAILRLNLTHRVAEADR